MKSAGRSWIVIALLGGMLGAALVSFADPSPKSYPDPAKFEKAIQAFEARDQQSPPPMGAIVCVGSSTMSGWNSTIQKDLAPLTVIPRGFGGSNMNDALHFVDRIVLKYQPKAIVLYEGDNDINQGISPEKICDAFKAFVAKVHGKLPQARIYVLSIKPSPSRWSMWSRTQQANRLIEAVCKQDNRLTFVNTADAMLGPDGVVRPELFKTDRLHMNPQGYALWRSILLPILMKNEQSVARVAPADAGDSAIRASHSVKP